MDRHTTQDIEDGYGDLSFSCDEEWYKADEVDADKKKDTARIKGLEEEIFHLYSILKEIHITKDYRLATEALKSMNHGH